MATIIRPPRNHFLDNIPFFDNQISTTVTNIASIVDQWIFDVLRIHRRRLHKLVVGLDIEWQPNFNRNVYNRVAILQLCVGRRCLIFQLLIADYIPQSLIDFLGNNSFMFVGVGIEQDVLKLDRDYGLWVSCFEDLRELAVTKMEMEELRNAGLKDLANKVLGLKIVKPKRVTLSAWHHWYLTSKQVRYACIDAFVSFEIGRCLFSGNY